MPCPVDFTCPDIDDIKREIEGIIKSLDGIISRINDITSTCEALLASDGLLEGLREANAALRSWGEEQEEEADDLRAELSLLSD